MSEEQHYFAVMFQDGSPPIAMLFKDMPAPELQRLLTDPVGNYMPEPCMVHRLPDDVDQALKLNDWQRQKNLELPNKVMRLAQDGHYNDRVVSVLVKFVKVEYKDTPERSRLVDLLESLPSRTHTGPEEMWQESAMDCFFRSDIKRLDSRRNILEATFAAITKAKGTP